MQLHAPEVRLQHVVHLVLDGELHGAWLSLECEQMQSKGNLSGGRETAAATRNWPTKETLSGGRERVAASANWPTGKTLLGFFAYPLDLTNSIQPVHLGLASVKGVK
jgi:hypothetical protein